MNKTKKIAVLGIVAVLFAVLTVSTASAHVLQYFDPDPISIPEGYCNTREVSVMVNITEGDTLYGGQFNIHYDQSCCNITVRPASGPPGQPEGWGPNILWTESSWNPPGCPECWGYGRHHVRYSYMWPQTGLQEICHVTIHCNSTDYCQTDLTFPYVGGNCKTEFINGSGQYIYDYTQVNGTFECGEAPPGEEYSADLLEDWNSISLPLIGTGVYADMTVDSVINTTLENKYDALVRYNATADEFEELSGSDEMDNGVGYFIHMTEAAEWSYWGLPYETMSVQLKSGLNLIGWVNETGTAIDTALDSIADDYNYNAKFDATAEAQNYSVYEPNAPDEFNDFAAMDRGNGYWIAAKNDCQLTYP